VIGLYLDSLSAELHVPRRERMRIVAEVRDHLEESVAAGRSELEAVEAFGEPRELAARFHEELASASARRAGWRTALLMVALFVGLAASTLGPANDFPFGVVVFIGAQLAFVAGGLGVARWLRYRHGVPPARLADLYRANGLAVACAGVVALAELMDAAINLSLALAVGSAVVLVAAAAAGLSVARSIARARVVEAGDAPTDDDALDDLLALRSLAPPAVGRLADRALELVPSWRWLDLRWHPWRFCLLVAAVCGVALAAQHGVAEGGATVAWRPLAAGLAIASIEAAAVISCFAVFGRFLGIRR
jgi:hypothetical protein